MNEDNKPDWYCCVCFPHTEEWKRATGKICEDCRELIELITIPTETPKLVENIRKYIRDK